MADDILRDPQTGISIRFIRQYDITADRAPTHLDVFTSAVDVALFLAARDTRDVPYLQKLRDACTFILDQPNRPIDG